MIYISEIKLTDMQNIICLASDNYGSCDFINTEYEECVVLLDGFCPVCGKKICIEEGETEPTPEECWQAFKQYYPGEYKEAMKIKRGEK